MTRSGERRDRLRLGTRARARAWVGAHLSQLPDGLVRVLGASGWTWWVDPRHAGAFRAEQLDPALSGARVLKKTVSRLVWAVDRPGADAVVIKRYRRRAAAEGWLEGRVRLSPARAEYLRTSRLRALGVPVVEPVAFGERRGMLRTVESALVTIELKGARSLREVLDDHPRAVPVGQLVRAALDLVGRVHTAGFSHDDLHADNILLSPAHPMSLVDLRRARPARSLTRRRREKDFAAIVAALIRRASRAEILDALQAIAASASPAREVIRPDVVMEAAAEVLAVRARVRARAVTRGGRRYRRDALLGVHWVSRVEEASPALSAMMADPEGALESARILKRGRSATVAMASPFVVKVFHRTPDRLRVADRVRTGRALRSLARAEFLDALRVPAAPCCAAGERRVRGLVTRGWLVMRELPGAVDLAVHASGGEPALAAFGRAGALLAALHDARAIHRDLKAGNLLVAPDGSVLFVDFDGIRLQRTAVSAARVARDLGRLVRDVVAWGVHVDARIAALIAGYADARGFDGIRRAELGRAVAKAR